MTKDRAGRICLGFVERLAGDVALAPRPRDSSLELRGSFGRVGGKVGREVRLPCRFASGVRDQEHADIPERGELGTVQEEAVDDQERAGRSDLDDLLRGRVGGFVEDGATHAGVVPAERFEQAGPYGREVVRVAVVALG